MAEQGGQKGWPLQPTQDTAHWKPSLHSPWVPGGLPGLQGSSASPSLLQGMVPNKPLSPHTPPQPGFWRIRTAMLFFLTLEILTRSTENLTTYLNAKNRPAE